LLTGIALDQGHLDSFNQKIYDIIPSYFDDDISKRSITIYHALTMQTGLEWENDKDTRPLITGKESSSLEMVLHKPLEFTPGTDYHYTDGNPQLISGIITARTNQSEEAFAASNLFDKMGITDFYWEKHPDGLNFGAVALYLKPRDFAKFGLLCLEDGNWSGEQLVSATWIDLSTQIHSYADEQHPYGFYWWIRPEYNAFTALGHGGQYIYVIPEKDLAIIMTSEPYAGQYDGYENLLEFEELIVKKVLESL
jgi:CubicO group peptidase (beta-lactamase class C family)